MKKNYPLIAFFVVVTIFSSEKLSWACSCAYAGDFCATVQEGRTYRDQSIVLVKVIAHSVYQDSLSLPLPGIDVQIMQHLAGEVPIFDTIFLIGQNGVNCAANLTPIQEGDELIVTLFEINKLTTWHSFSETPDRHLKLLWGCGTSYMRVDGDLLLQYHPWMDQIDTLVRQDFMDDFEMCTGFPLITTTTQEKPIWDVSVFPNPSTGKFLVEKKDIAGPIQYAIYDLVGKRISEGIVTNAQKAEIFLDNVKPGLYLLSLRAGKKYFMQRVVMQ